MAIDKKKFLEMMMRPEALSAADVDVEAEDIESDLNQSVENPEKPYSVPAQIKAGVKAVSENDMDSPEVIRESEQSIGLSDQYKADPEMSELAGKVNAGSAQNSADLELRKKAIAATMKKYLGR